jgi:3-hydroxybutyryl-CoA dehydrogenase
MEIKKVGVVGCGQMGAGIAQVSAQAGYQAVVSEISDELLKKGMDSLTKILDRNVSSGKISQQDKDAILSRIKGTTSNTDFAECDLVIEAAVENMELKRKIFANLDRICPENTLLATNTSCLSITDLAMATGRPDKVLGIHFFNPVPVMQLVEIVKTIAVSDDTLKAGEDFGKSVGKTVVVTQDSPGFIVNRLIMPLILNAIRLLENNTANAEDIDTAMKLGLNHPIGPLALADLIGLDTVYFIVNAIYQELKDPQYVAPLLLKKMVTAGRFGRKTKTGFYEYHK